MTINTDTDTFVKYDSNNSGGSWWLDDADWFALEKAGWEIAWARDDGDGQERWLGALAKGARRQGLGLMEAVSEWESVTGQTATDAGCACCGQPHRFTLYKDGKYVTSGPSVRFEASWD